MTTPDGVRVWATSDLGSAAYARSRGKLKIHGVTRQGLRGDKFVFSFEDPEGKGPQLMIDYMNSPEREFDEAVRSLKKLCYDPVPESQTPRPNKHR